MDKVIGTVIFDPHLEREDAVLDLVSLFKTAAQNIGIKIFYGFDLSDNGMVDTLPGSYEDKVFQRDFDALQIHVFNADPAIHDEIACADLFNQKADTTLSFTIDRQYFEAVCQALSVRQPVGVKLSRTP